MHGQVREVPTVGVQWNLEVLTVLQRNKILSSPTERSSAQMLRVVQMKINPL